MPSEFPVLSMHFTTDNQSLKQNFCSPDIYFPPFDNVVTSNVALHVQALTALFLAVTSFQFKDFNCKTLASRFAVQTVSNQIPDGTNGKKLLRLFTKPLVPNLIEYPLFMYGGSFSTHTAYLPRPFSSLSVIGNFCTPITFTFIFQIYSCFLTHLYHRRPFQF